MHNSLFHKRFRRNEVARLRHANFYVGIFNATDSRKAAPCGFILNLMDMFAHKPYTSNFKSIVLDSYVYSATNQIFIFLFFAWRSLASICRNAPCGFP
jgi:hypothetical protein